MTIHQKYQIVTCLSKMKAIAVLCAFFSSFSLYYAFNQITRTSPHTIHKKLSLAPSDNITLELANLMLNSETAASLAIFLFFRGKNLKESQLVHEKRLNDILQNKLKCFEDKTIAELDHFKDTLIVKDETLKKDLIHLNELWNTKFEIYKLASNQAKSTDEVSDSNIDIL